MVHLSEFWAYKLLFLQFMYNHTTEDYFKLEPFLKYPEAILSFIL